MSETVLNPTYLRAHLYECLDQVAERGQVVEVERKGVILRISRREEAGRLARLAERPTLACTPDELVETGFADTWQGGL